MATKPSHAFYGRLPLTEIRDPTCHELQNAVSKQCGRIDIEHEYTMGAFCGLGTTWNIQYQKCVRTPDEYITIDGIGKPFGESPYPSIRPEGYKTPFDEPDSKYIYVSKDQHPGFRGGISRSIRAGSDCQKCSAHRCRFPLTSEEGRKQATLYVSLFREIYDYVGTEESKQTLRYRIRTLIEDHEIYFSNTGIHSDGLFLPWHRWYLLEMETILMQGQDEFGTATDCSNTFVGIPYFDWHNLKNGETVDEFINDADDTMGHHFGDSLGQSRSRGIVNCQPLRGALEGLRLINGNGPVTRCWNNQIFVEGDIHQELHNIFPEPTQYNQFRNRLMNGQGLHGAVHNLIGGTMATQLSSNDPIFYCHHGNVDKIWNDWQKQSSAHLRAYYTTDGSARWDRYNPMPGSLASPNNVLDLTRQYYQPPGENDKTVISAEYVDLDTSSMWGRGHTSTIRS